MGQCWMVCPKDRPTFSELRTKFDSLISAQKDHMPYIDLDIDSHSPYYAHLASNSCGDDNGSLANLSNTDQPSSAREIGSIASSIPMGLEDTSKIPGPVSNPYVDTPTVFASCNGPNDGQDRRERND